METVVGLPDASFWRGRRVLLTGHTGFKGAWLALWLDRLGAEVTALSLPAEPGPNLYGLARVAQCCSGHFADLYDAPAMASVVKRASPQIVLHLAAQALVRRSLADPVRTFATNVMGTVNLLNALRDAEGVEGVLVVTSDKVYANSGSDQPKREGDPLGGKDPYSASKAACELAAHSFADSFLTGRGIALATARAGNVIGGGDFAEDRIVPDCVRAAMTGEPIVLRHPHATRPWQHVLDCLCGYLLYAERLPGAPGTAPRTLNFGPEPGRDLPVAELARSMLYALGAASSIVVKEPEYSVEAPRLSLDSTQASHILGWRDRLVGPEAIAATAAWYRCWRAGEDMREVTLAEIDRYRSGGGGNP